MKCDLTLLFRPEENASLRSFATSWPGRVLLVALMVLAVAYVRWPHVTWKSFFVLLAACAAYMPQFRVRVLLVGAVIWTLHRIPHSALGRGFLLHHLMPAVLIFAMGVGILLLARRMGRKGLFAYPVVSLLAVVSLLIVLSQIQGVPPVMRYICWELAVLLSVSKWFLAYAINNVTARRPKPGSILENLAVLHPFWGGGQVPIGKGWSYIRKHEARNKEHLARVQIRAVHLILTVMLIRVAYTGYLHLTGWVANPVSYMGAMLDGQHPSRFLAALSLPVSFFGLLLNGYIWGNSAIALARFAGYDLQQNMINPLFSRSIADFWNRWYFYFKELLVEFFFLPSFRRAGWMPERLRVFTATLMAAGFGNYVFHLYQKIGFIRHVGLAAYLGSSGLYAIYCLILGVGIGISQAINPLTPADGNKRNFKPHVCLGVIGFFCLVSPLGWEEPALVLAQHGRFGITDYLKFYAYICGVM